MVTRRAAARTGTDSLKAAQGMPASLDACLSAAEAHAERFLGDGPVPRWRPSLRPTPWVAGIALAVAVGSALTWPWGGAAVPGGAAAVLVVASGAPSAAAVPSAEPAVNVVAFEPQPHGATAPTPRDEPAAPGLPGADTPAWPTDLDAWALDPQTIAAPSGRSPSVRHRLHNTPVIPDDADPTPGEEGPSDEDLGGGPSAD